MPFLYDFTIDNEKVNVEMGFSTSRKWEEALDEAKLTIPFSYLNDKPYKMFSMVNIEITEIASYLNRTPIAVKNYEFIIYSDRPEAVGVYGYYQHNVSAIEYTAKLDYYLVRQLAKSRSIIRNIQAPFYNHIITSSSNTQWFSRVTLENLPINQSIKANSEITFKQVYEAYVASGSEPSGYKRTPSVITTNAPLISGTSPHVLSNDPATWVFPKGQWQIKYGFIADGTEGYSYSVGFNEVFTFYVEAIDSNELSMWDVVSEIRDCISKFGGIEDTRYYESTRIFDIDPQYEDLLKNTQAPQIYMSNATARQMLIYTLSFINSLPRLIRGEELDLLTLEQYNLDRGSFQIEDVVGFASEQNTNQIGTRNYQNITQGLANDLDDKSLVTPSHSGYQQVRSADVQLTANNFTIKLPERSPLYMPTNMIVKVPRIRVVAGGVATLIDWTNYDLDITPRWVNAEEWRLKEITEDFPTIQSRPIFDNELGLRNWRVENIQWNIGDTEIRISDIFGLVFQDNLIRNVVLMAVYEKVMLNLPVPILVGGTFSGNMEIIVDLPSTNEYRDWRFRVEYITDERLVIKQDKEDLEQVSFYSEMRQNQEESLVNIVRQSKKGYGDLQRTGNVTFSFSKKHTTLGEFYQVGQKDVNKYTVTQIDTHWFNDYAIATYHVTRYHNRIQQATFVNQKYRPFDNFAKTVLDRHEYYGDYLIAIPPNDMSTNINDQSTKIYSNDRTVRKIVEILLGGEYNLPKKQSVSVALIRTDGMLEQFDEAGDNIARFISTPVTARGIKGGFIFTFGFANNQIAGDRLISKTHNNVTTYYNDAVRYTDNKGRFSRFGFAIMKDMIYDSGDDLSYPLVENNAVAFQSSFLANTYFWCGMYQLNEPFEHPLVWNKDPMTNTALSYGLNVLSYYVGLYVFGIKFFTDNYLVREHDLLKHAVLYTYQNGTTYDMFDDLYVKEGYSNSYVLKDNFYENNGNIEYDSVTNSVRFIGIPLMFRTSWAIGIPNNDNNQIELLIACNENINGVKFINRHVRPGVNEIGDRSLRESWLSLDNQYDLSANFTYVRGREVEQTVNGEYSFIGNIEFYVNESVPLTINLSFLMSYEMDYYRSKDVGNTINLGYTMSGEFEFDVQKGINLDSEMMMSFNIITTKNIQQSMSAQFSTTYDLQHRKSKNIGQTINTVFTTNYNLAFNKNIGQVLNHGYSMTYDVAYSKQGNNEINSEMDLGFTLLFLKNVNQTLASTLEMEYNIQYSKATNPPSNWQQTSTTSTSPSENYPTGDMDCRSASVIRDWLMIEYPPSGYAIGTIFRVRVIRSDETPCATYYYEAVQ